MCHRSWFRTQTCSVVNLISFKALVYTLCEDNLVPWLRYSFSDISISVSVHVCVYDVGCFVNVLASRSGHCVRKLSVPMIAILLAPRWVCSIE